eukprot:g1530.t1
MSDESPLSWYSCGPTTYDDAHLGHGRCYVCTDIIRRVMTEVFGVDVFFVLGVTDIDDKIIARAAERQEEPLALARHYEQKFFEDLDALNVLRPNAITRVSEHIQECIDYTSQIVANGHGYVASDGVYFDTSSLKTYAESLGTAEAASEAAPLGRNDVKKNRRDFALWKLTDDMTFD